MTTHRLLAGELTPHVLLSAYSSGYFPMAASKSGPIAWYSPDPRCVIPLNGFHVPRSLRRTIRRRVFSVTTNKAFERVIVACANRSETWISDEIIEAYIGLHNAGFAHSVEAWQEGRLCGGLYGVAMGAAFFGESMFSREADASKACLVYLIEALKLGGYMLLDSQIINDHVRQFGAMEIPRKQYLRRLVAALEVKTPPWGDVFSKIVL